jgi:hypothetical protein
LVKKLLQGMLTFDYRKRMSCEDVDQLLRFSQQPSVDLNNGVQICPENVPSLNFNSFSSNRRDSEFYRSAITPSDRSHPEFNKHQQQ